MDLTTDTARLWGNFNEELRRFTLSWTDDPQFTQQAFQELISSHAKNGHFDLVVAARIRLGELLESSKKPQEAAEQYTLALHLTLTHASGDYSEDATIETARALLWDIFRAQMAAQSYAEAAKTAELSLSAYYRARIGSSRTSVQVMIRSIGQVDAMKAALEASRGGWTWEDVHAQMHDI